MSRFSGKCDFADTISIDLDCGMSKENILKSYKIEIYDNNGYKKELHSHKFEDLIPYYPHIVCVGSWSRENGRYVLLSSESYVTSENRNICQMYIQTFHRAAEKEKRRQKRQGTYIDRKHPFNYRLYFKQWLCEQNQIRKIDDAYVNAIDQAIDNQWKLDRIIYKYSDTALYFRDQLRQEMLKNNINPANFGY